MSEICIEVSGPNLDCLFAGKTLRLASGAERLINRYPEEIKQLIDEEFGLRSFIEANEALLLEHRKTETVEIGQAYHYLRLLGEGNFVVFYPLEQGRFNIDFSWDYYFPEPLRDGDYITSPSKIGGFEIKRLSPFIVSISTN